MALDRSWRSAHGQDVRSCIASLTPRSKTWFERDGRFAIGEGGIELLRAIVSTGSLAGASRELGWSYRHAWGYLRRAEKAIGLPLCATRTGKGPERGMTLSPAGRALIRAFERIHARHLSYRGTK